MYLFPTKDEIDALWREISPRHRFLRAARQAVDEACRLDGDSMAAFFLESDDVYLREEEGAMVYHIDPPAYLESPRDVCPVRFSGWDIEIPNEYAGINLGKKVSWDEI